MFDFSSNAISFTFSAFQSTHANQVERLLFRFCLLSVLLDGIVVFRRRLLLQASRLPHPHRWRGRRSRHQPARYVRRTARLMRSIWSCSSVVHCICIYSLWCDERCNSLRFPPCGPLRRLLLHRLPIWKSSNIAPLNFSISPPLLQGFRARFLAT